MSQNSTLLSLPYLQPSQAQKHVTHNEALRILDTVTQLSVVATGATQPPLTPAQGAVYGLGEGCTGDWSGRDLSLAAFDDGAWHFTVPRIGWRAWDQGSDALIVWDGAAWVPLSQQTQNLDGLGVGTSWDTTNRLAVAADATLLTHAGTGHQLKVNKSAAADTASLLFQTGFSGRAEMGLAGTDDFAVKVSDDGTTWRTAFSFDASSAYMAVGHADPDVHFHVKGPGNAEARIESQSWATATVTAKGRRTGNNAEIAKLRFVNQEDIPGSDSAEAALTAFRNGADGIGLRVTTCTAGAPVEAFAISHSGQLDQLRLAPGPAPATPVAGQIYFDDTSAKLRCYDGTVWRDLY